MMSPLLAAWLLSAAGALAFLALGYVLRGLRRSASGEAGRAPHRQAAAGETVDALERELAELESEAVEDRRAHHAAEARAARLLEAIEQQRAHAARDRQVRDEAEARVSSLERELAAEQEQRRKIAEDLSRQDGAARGLLAKLKKLRVALAEQQRRAAEAKLEAEALREDALTRAEIRQSATGVEKELVLAATLREFIERPRPESAEADPTSAEDATSAGLRRPEPTDEPGRMRRLERRVRSVSSPTSEDEGAKGAQPRVRTIDGGASDIDGLLRELARDADLSQALVSDLNGLPLGSVGEASDLDALAVFSALLGQLTTHATDFLPMEEILCCSLRDETGRVYTIWNVGAGRDAVFLSAASRGTVPEGQAVERTLEALRRALG